MDVRLPDGTLIRNVPDGMSKAELTAKLQANGYDISKLAAPAPTEQVAAAPAAPKGPAPLTGAAGFFESVGAPLAGLSQGVSKGIGDVMFGGQRLVGMGLEKAGAEGVGRALQEDAARRKLAEQAAIADIKKQQPLATGTGEMVGEVVGTLPVGGAIAAPIKKAAQMAPSLARFLTPAAIAIESGGFKGTNLATKAGGGAVAGGGLTVIANAPNPAGIAILRQYFPNGAVSALYLLIAALPPTLVAILAYRLI